MSNFIPGNYPSPDQDNVYYNIQALVARMRGNLLDETLDTLSAQLLEYQLPAFVLDETLAPNSYTVMIYPKTGATNQIFVSDEAITDATVAPTGPTIIDASPINMQDGGIPITLDPRYHSNSRIKEGDFIQASATDGTYAAKVVLLSATKFVEQADIVEKNNQNAEIIRNITANQLMGLPDALLSEYQEEYDDVVEKIEELLETLQRVVDGEKETIDKIADTLIWDSYYSGNVVSDQEAAVSNEVNRKSLSSKYIGLAFRQLARMSNGDDQENDSSYPLTGRFTKPSDLQYDSSCSETSQDQKFLSSESGTMSADLMNKVSIFWKKFLKSEELDIDIEGEAVGTYPSSSLHFDNPPVSWFEQLLKYNSGSQTKSTFDPEDGWLKTWYYDNLSDQIERKQVNFESMDSYIADFTSRLEEVQESANLYALEGNGLTVIQAILRAINNLCQNNVDISKHAPGWSSTMPTKWIGGSNVWGQVSPVPQSGITFFDGIGRTPILGASGTHPYPSKHGNLAANEVGEGENQIDLSEYIDPVNSYSNNAFLNFNSIITILDNLRGYKDTTYSSGENPYSFLVNNIRTLDSDHDSVINLWEAVSDYNINMAYHMHVGHYLQGIQSAQERSGEDFYQNASLGEGTKSAKDLAHLYKINEGHLGRRIYLLPTTPSTYGTEPHMYSFLSYRMGHQHFMDWLISDEDLETSQDINYDGDDTGQGFVVPDSSKTSATADDFKCAHPIFEMQGYMHPSELPISDGCEGTGGGLLAKRGEADSSLMGMDGVYTKMGWNYTFGPIESSVPENGRQVPYDEELSGGGFNAGAPGWMNDGGHTVGEDVLNEKGFGDTYDGTHTQQDPAVSGDDIPPPETSGSGI